MRGACSTAALIVMLAPTVARGDWEYTRWGMTPEQVAQASRGTVKVLPPDKRRIHPDPFSSETAAAGTFADGALRLKLSFSFGLQTQGLTCVVFTSQDQDELFRQMFFRRLGEPQASADHSEYGMKTFTWDKQDEVGLTLMKGASFATQCKPGSIPPVE